MPQMIIANRLRDGTVVFLAPNEGWEPAIAAGVVIEDQADAERLLALAKRHEAECVVIDPQLIDVEIRDGAPRPTAIREAIRAFGPTVRTDLTEA
jgi:nucleotide-binding universal stress UspA family protein